MRARSLKAAGRVGRSDDRRGSNSAPSLDAPAGPKKAPASTPVYVKTGARSSRNASMGFLVAAADRQGLARTIVLTLPAEVKAAAPAYATARKPRPTGSHQVCAKPLASDIQQMVATKKPCNHCGFAARPAQHRRNINIDAPFRPRRRVKLGAELEPRRSSDRPTRPAALSDRALITTTGVM